MAMSAGPTRAENPTAEAADAISRNPADPVGFWQPAEMSLSGGQSAQFAGISAHLGARLTEFPSQLRPEPEPETEPRPQSGYEPEPEIIEAVAFGEERFAQPREFALRPPAPEPRPLLRIVRRRPAAANSPRYGTAEPAYRRETGGGMTATALPAARDRSGFVLAVTLMVALWVGVVGVGTMFFNTPPSGLKIQWR